MQTDTGKWRWTNMLRLGTLRNERYAAMIRNAASLMGTTAVTAALGFVYWWVAERRFPTHSVGIASAAVSAMTLLGTIGMLGLGTLLMGELPRRRRHRAPALVTTALLVAGSISVLLGGLFALLAPNISTELRPIAERFDHVLIFAAGTGLTAMVLVLDQASLGVMHGELQFIRNVIFAVAKLIALVALAVWFIAGTGFSIYVTWVIGIAVSLVALVGLEIAQGRIHWGYRPRKDALRGMEMHALQHHGLNLVLIGPGLLLPMIVTAMLSATTNAYFYTAWMLNGLVSVVPVALATVLYAASSADPAQRRQKLRFSMGLAFAYSLVAIVVVFIAAPWILGLFGPNYAAQAAVPLTLLVLGVLPTVISEHYVALRRIDREPGRAAAPLAVGSVVKLILAFVGAKTAGLVGFSIGIVAANFLVALYVTPTMLAALRGSEKVTVAATKLG